MDSRILIGPIDTIGVAVANPSFGYTLSATPVLVGHTRELPVGIALTSVALVSYVFIRVVETIVIAVTDVNPRNTIAVIASEEISKAGPLFTLAVLFGFICFRTSTIIIAIAIPSGGNAPVVGTPEAIGRTRSLGTN